MALVFPHRGKRKSRAPGNSANAENWMDNAYLMAYKTRNNAQFLFFFARCRHPYLSNIIFDPSLYSSA